MQKLSSLLFTTLIGISIVALAHESMAQTSAAPSKTGTRLITLGTAGWSNPASGPSAIVQSPNCQRHALRH